MRRSLSILAAAAIAVGASAVSFSSAAMATPRPAPAAIDSAIIQVDWESREWGHGGGHNAFRDDRGDRWNNGWGQRRHHRFRHSRHFRRDPFYFGFPFAFRPQFYPYRRRGDCFRTWEGYIVCR